MKRSEMIRTIKKDSGEWDIIIIGGGATGLGTAVDAASRGFKTLLLEMNDFAKGTSSRSTKLIHGGVRYLEQGNLSLVLEALKERGILMKNAPHLVYSKPFLVPYYKWWEGLYYWIGLKLYDILAGRLGLGKATFFSVDKVLEEIPTISSEKLKGGVLYYDGQFDDSRLAINLAKTGAEKGGTLVNYMKVTDLLKSGERVTGVKAVDTINGEKFKIKAKVVINATGVFTDNILKMDNPDSQSIITPSQGIHIVIDRHFLPGDTAVMIPKTKDGRVLFALPWYNKVMIGTTDTPIKNISSEPEAMEKEIDYILKHISGYLKKNPRKSDIKSVFAGLRPLVTNGNSENTAAISRDHSIIVSSSGLITITGGKWTTYRRMAEEVVDKAQSLNNLKENSCVTEELQIHGWTEEIDSSDPLYYYGSDKTRIRKIVERRPKLGDKLHKDLPYIKAEVVWATRNEMAMTVEDFCSRRTRALLLNAEASKEMAPEVARLMAEEAGHDQVWINKQIDMFTNLANSYHISEKISQS